MKQNMHLWMPGAHICVHGEKSHYYNFTGVNCRQSTDVFYSSFCIRDQSKDLKKGFR